MHVVKNMRRKEKIMLNYIFNFPLDNESMLKKEAQLQERNEVDIQKESVDEYNSENDFLGISDIEENSDQDLLLLSESINFDLVDGMEHLDVSKMQENHNSTSLSAPKDSMKQSTLIETSTPNAPGNEAQKNENISHDTLQVSKDKNSAEQPLISPRSPDSLLNSLIGNVKSEIADKERAAKILLHTRNFRQYVLNIPYTSAFQLFYILKHFYGVRIF